MHSQKPYAKAQIALIKKLLEGELSEYFKKEEERVAPIYGEHSLKILSTSNEFTVRDAKRLRGSFVYYIYKMLGGTDEEVAIKAAMAIELIHAYLLIEDDYMDISDSRRGGPTAHIALKVYHQENFKKGDPVHSGNSLALLGSLMLSHLAMKMINELDLDPIILKNVNINLNKCLNVTVHGQINDVVNELKDAVTEQDVLNVLLWKTSVYTYENPIHMGALLAGANEATLAKLSEYAIPAGIAFQIQDDILGMFGETEVTGKSNMDDLKEGKVTLLIHHALEKADDSQKEIILAALGNREATAQMHKEVQKVIVDTGSLNYSKEMAQKYVREAKENILKLREPNWSDEGFNYLVGIADYMIERDL